MKRNTTSLLLLLLPTFLVVTGCSDSNDNSGTEGSYERIELYASGSGLTTATRAAADITPFEATVFATTRQGIYTDLSGDYEWTKEVEVGADRSVTFSDPAPNYPVSGAWIYLSSLAPKAEDINEGAVSYTLDGTQDLLYAKEIKGNKWDNYRFAGNPVASNDKPLAFEHLLTQLQFKAVKTITGGLPVTITKITVKNVKTKVSVPVTDGKAVFSGDSDVDLSLDANNTVTNQTPVYLGNLLLPPLASGTYTITVETSAGIFANVNITLGNTSDVPDFGPGVSHEITLNITDTYLGIATVAVASWTPDSGGNLDLIE